MDFPSEPRAAASTAAETADSTATATPPQPPAPPGRKTTYQPALDGLRALALVSVMLYHTGLFQAGWAGVPLFFALSGHFITRTLLKETVTSRAVRAKNFLRNRALRLAPLYLTFCVVLTVLACIDYGDGSIAGNLGWFWTWTCDLAPMSHHFRPTSMELYTHLWSLGVEVQIYVLWAACALWLPRRWFVRGVVAIALGGPLLRLALWAVLSRTGYNDAIRPVVIYTSPLTYLDVFAVGACTALPELRSRLRVPARAVLFTFPLLVAVLVIRELALGNGFTGDFGFPVILAEHYRWVWQYSALALFCGALVHEVGRGGRLAALLSPPALVRIGVISYGIYIVHVPLLGQYLRWKQVQVNGSAWSTNGLIVAALVLVSAIAVAELSYRVLEEPFLRRKRDALVQPGGGTRGGTS